MRVAAFGPVRAAALRWRLAGRLHVTVAAKCVLSIEPRGVMGLRAPEPLEAALGELVPRKPMADVVIVGAHAHARSPEGAEAMTVRLAVQRSATLLDKTLIAYAPRPGGVARPFRQAPLVVFGRQSEQLLLVDPQRPSERARLGPMDAPPSAGARGVLELERSVRWESFQIAPPDQRLVHLEGDEWVVLEGLHRGFRRLKSRLPGMRVEASVLPPGLSAGRALAVGMSLDQVSIDADRMRCALTWRGSFAVEDEATAEQLVLLVTATAGAAMPRPRAADVRAAIGREEAGALAPTEPDPTRESDLAARARARIARLGPLATLRIEGDTEPLETEDRRELHATAEGVVSLRSAGEGIRLGGTLELPPDPDALAPLHPEILLGPQLWEGGLGSTSTAPLEQVDEPPELPERSLGELVGALEATRSLEDQSGEVAALRERFRK